MVTVGVNVEILQISLVIFIKEMENICIIKEHI